MLGRASLVKRRRFRVQLHIAGVNPRPEYPWVVEVAFSSLDQENLQIMIQIRQTAHSQYKISCR